MRRVAQQVTVARVFIPPFGGSPAVLILAQRGYSFDGEVGASNTPAPPQPLMPSPTFANSSCRHGVDACAVKLFEPLASERHSVGAFQAPLPANLAGGLLCSQGGLHSLDQFRAWHPHAYSVSWHHRMRNGSGKSHVLAGAVISDMRRTQKIGYSVPLTSWS
jgi:hypothetical protein